MFRLFICLLVFVGITILLDSCMQFRMSKNEIDTHFNKVHQHAQQVEYKVGKRTIHYAKTGNEDAPLVVFVHGSPGSLGDFIQFLSDTSLQKHAVLISVDRPGFGQSNFGWAEPSLHEQAKLIKELIEKNKRNQPVILVGHSLGGPVIARISMDYPELVDGLVFVAASVDPDLEPARWWRAPFVTPFFRWIFPRSMRASNDEIYPLKPELEEMMDMWKNIRSKTIVIQGTKDSLVPAANAEFIKRQITATEPIMRYEEGMDHFVPWSHPHLIKNAVLDMLKQVSK